MKPGHHAFVVAIAYGIQLLEKEPRNVADRHHSNRRRIASNRKRLTTHFYNELLKEHMPHQKFFVLLIFKYQ